jgi:hypothetical protein
VSDAAPPGEPPDGTPFPEPPPEKQGFAAWPLWTRVLVVSAGVLVLVVIGYGLWQAAAGDDEVATIEDVLDELADEEQTATTSLPPPITSAAPATSVAAEARTEAPTTTAATATTVAPPTTSKTSTTSTTTTTTTVAPTTTSTTTSTTSTTSTTTTTTLAPTTTTPRRATRTSTTVAPTTTSTTTSTTSTTTTTVAPTTIAPTTVAPPTTLAPTTVAPPTTAPATTVAPPTTAPAPTTVPPALTIPLAPGAVAPNARGFAERWNANAAGTNVPVLTEGEVTDLENGPAATTFIAPLSDEVGLVGVVRNDDQSVAEVLLVWIPGGDEAASNQLYRDAFDVLVRTVNPELTVDERVDLGIDLGLTAQAPPFPTDDRVTVDAFPDRYSRFVRDTTAADDTAIISVVDARPR